MKLSAQPRNPKIKACLGSFDLSLRNHLNLNHSTTIRTATRVRKDLIVTVLTTHWGTPSKFGFSVYFQYCDYF